MNNQQNRKILVALVTFLIIASSAILWRFLIHSEANTNSNQVQNQTTNSSQLPLADESSVLDDLGEKHLSMSEINRLGAKIEMWNLYQEDPSVVIGIPDCGVSKNSDMLKSMNSGSKKTLSINSTYRLVLTPAYSLKNFNDVVQFRNDPTVICGIGAYYPFSISEDRLLWRQSCSSGAVPAVGTQSYKDFVSCIQAQEVVQRHFKEI